VDHAASGRGFHARFAAFCGGANHPTVCRYNTSASTSSLTASGPATSLFEKREFERAQTLHNTLRPLAHSHVWRTHAPHPNDGTPLTHAASTPLPTCLPAAAPAAYPNWKGNAAVSAEWSRRNVRASSAGYQKRSRNVLTRTNDSQPATQGQAVSARAARALLRPRFAGLRVGCGARAGGQLPCRVPVDEASEALAGPCAAAGSSLLAAVFAVRCGQEASLVVNHRATDVEGPAAQTAHGARVTRNCV
jgi:hypothetical protein